MSRINKMSLKAIIDQTDLILQPNDIIYISDDGGLIDKYIALCKTAASNGNKAKDLLLENEKYINKEKFILLTVKNYIENIKVLKKYLEELLEKQELYNDSKETLRKVASLKMQIAQQEENLQKAIRLGKGIDTVLTAYYYDEKEKRYRVAVVDSQKIIDGKNTKNSQALKRFDQVDLNFKGGKKEESLGLEFVLQSMLLTDIYEVFPDRDFGNYVRSMILENQVLIKGIKTKEQLEELKSIQTYDTYAEIIDNISFEGLFPFIKDTLREYAEYIDMDKLLLISAYRFYEALENGYIDERLHYGVKEILQGIVGNIKTKGLQISCELQSKKDNTYDLEQITYSTNDVKKCISQFASDRYITDEELERYRGQVNNCEISLIDILPEHIDIAFSQEELERLATLSLDNLIYVSNKYEWDGLKIVELYETNQ